MHILQLNFAMTKHSNMPGLPSFAYKKLKAQWNVQYAVRIRKLLLQTASQSAFQVIIGPILYILQLYQTRKLHGYVYQRVRQSLQVLLDPTKIVFRYTKPWIYLTARLE